jgi:hypothetical protein
MLKGTILKPYVASDEIKKKKLDLTLWFKLGK